MEQKNKNRNSGFKLRGEQLLSLMIIRNNYFLSYRKYFNAHKEVTHVIKIDMPLSVERIDRPSKLSYFAKIRSLPSF